jgi:release factor glutamine methyltransferase
MHDEMEEADRYMELVLRRARRIPLQQLTGEQFFMGLPFLVTEDVLIPRMDTETLVQEALARLSPGQRVLDLCTGSGCILISLLKLGDGLRGTGTDASQAALETARENARRLGVLETAEFVCGDLFSGAEGTWDMIVSNPPYIASGQIPELMEEVRAHEPRMALDGGADGLDFYRRIAQHAPAHLTPGGMLAVEAGDGESEAIAALFREAGLSDVAIRNDLYGMPRMVSALAKE